jgi:hypothetical protein
MVEDRKRRERSALYEIRALSRPIGVHVFVTNLTAGPALSDTHAVRELASAKASRVNERARSDNPEYVVRGPGGS